MPSSSSVPNEDSPLLALQEGITQDANAGPDDDDSIDELYIGDASVPQTIVNMAKTCMGTGCLVLPFAAVKGGLLLHVFGLMAIAAWNVYTVERLCRCLNYLPIRHHATRKRGEGNSHDNHPKLPSYVNGETAGTTSTTSLLSKDTDIIDNTTTENKDNYHHHLHHLHLHPPEGTAMFGKVVWYAVGPPGLLALDLLMLAFLCGILVTYINAMRSFLRATPMTTGSDVIDALLLVAIMGPLSCVPHMGYLAKASAMGLLVLAGTFVVIGAYGLENFWKTAANAPVGYSAWKTLSMLPQNGLWGVSHWFGCVVFSFGVAPLTYNFRSSMADPSKMSTATGWALIGVALAYMGVGVGFWILYPDLESDLLQQLPTTGILPAITRLAMVVVVLTTAPLLIVPCGELVEGKVTQLAHCQHLAEDQHHHNRRVIFRFGICILGAGISIYVPGFVDVLSFVGCCCVACLGFCIPPLLHALLCFQARRQKPMNLVTLTIDILMLSWGIFATVVSTTYTFRQLSLGPDEDVNVNSNGVK